MKKIYFLFVSSAIIFSSCNENKTAEEKLNYPKTRKDTAVVDDYFGTKISDSYRWLEDDNSEETKQWVKQQNELTFSYLEKIPFRNKIKERLTKIWNFPKETAPFKKGPYYFFYKNDGIQNQNVLYCKKGIRGEAKLLLDPNKLSDDGTVALNTLGIDKDAKHLGYSVSRAGSDWNEIFVMNIETGEQLPDHLKWVKFSGVSWQSDGFYYSRFEETKKGGELSQANENHKVYFHKLGTKQEEDQLIYEDKEHPKRSFSLGVSEDEKYLFLYGYESTSGNSLAFREVKSKEKNFIPVITSFENNYVVIDNISENFLVQTDKNAPKYRVILVNPKTPDAEKIIIPEKEDVLESAAIANGKIVAKYLKDVSNKIFVHSISGELLNEIQLPGLGIVNSLNTDKNDSLLFFTFENFTIAPSVYQYNLNANSTEISWKPIIDFNSEEYETKQIFYHSKDGTKVPMFITHKKGIELNGNNPAFLYGYGGFNISVTPRFSIVNLVFLENGGVYAVANMRGGGEYGEEWHKAGTKLHKQNVFDDFIAAAEYLIKEKYTNSQKLAVHGRSNGGLLIGAVMTQRPDLYKVCIPGVGVLDMLRFHKFTIGKHWSSDYGNSEDEENFKNLLKYSPLQNVKDAEYPATLVTTADHDDRVVPAHSFKFAATLQEHQKGANPSLIRIDVSAGHGAGKPVSKQIDEWADIWSFVFYNLGMNCK